MVFGNVPKLHALIAVLAGVVAVPIGCSGSDFSGCEASRTCPPPGGNAGEGGDGDGTGGSDRGGSPSSGAGGTQGGTAGTAGTGGTDEGGNGGAPDPDDREPPTIVSFAPDDGDVEVERDIAVTVTFSEPIDEQSVTDANVTLTGPDGDVAGELSVDGAVVSFVPERKLYLLGDYTVTIGEGVADLAGNTLGEEASVGFRVRDGRWSEPVYPFGETPRFTSAFARNAAGDIVLGGATNDADTRPWVSIYTASENRWTRDVTVRSMPAADLQVFDAAIDIERRAALTWGGSSVDEGGWFRYTEQGGWSDSGAQSNHSYVTVTSRGEVVAVWGDGSDILGQTQDIPAGTVQPAERIGPQDRIICAIIPSLEKAAMITRVWPSGDNTIHVTWYDPSSGWGLPEPLASDPEIAQVAADSDEHGNLVVVWTQSSEIWSRVYERPQARWTAPMLIATVASSRAYAGALDMANGRIIATFGIQSTTDPWGAYYEPGIGWVQNSIQRLSGAGIFNVGPAAMIDVAGNALVAWARPMNFRRYVRGQGWSEESQPTYELEPLNGASAPDGSATVVGSNEIRSGEYVPRVVRFE